MPITTVISFGGSILAFGDGQLAFDLDTGAPIDLAGARRALAANPALDPVTGELHLLTFGIDPVQLHVCVSPGALTRTIRPIEGAPGRIQQLALTRDRVVLLADGFVGLIERAGYDARAVWFPIDTAARHIAAAGDDGETVVVYVTGPSLARWTLHPRARIAHSEVLDGIPQICGAQAESRGSNAWPPSSGGEPARAAKLRVLDDVADT